jgi:hypothetical protein
MLSISMWKHRCLGFINRKNKEFKNEKYLKTLFTSLVKPIME